MADIVDGGDGSTVPGGLSTETVEERRARLITPRAIGSTEWRRTLVVLSVALVVLVGVWFGVVPGSTSVGRYPVWDLYELAERIDHANADMPTCGGTPTRAQVNLVTGRVEAADANLDLTAEERGMTSGLAREGVLRSVFCARRSDAVR